MKKSFFVQTLLISFWALISITTAYASIPMWTFSPLTATSISIPSNGTATVRYQVTNQARSLRTLVLSPVQGITQIVTGGNCPNPFILNPQQSCTLRLKITASQLAGNLSGGPVVCEQGNPLQCYQPSAANILNITKTPGKYSVGGKVFGLSGTDVHGPLILQNNGGDSLTIRADGTFAFSQKQTSGTNYSVSVLSEPDNQTCTVSHGSGTVGTSDVRSIRVYCAINSYTVGGNISGLGAGKSVVLLNNDSDPLTVNANGVFTFSKKVAEGAPYSVTVLTQPLAQTCTVSNGSGIMGNSNVTTVVVTCNTNSFTVGGTVSGLDANNSLVLQNNGSDPLTITSNGGFTFPTPVAQGSPYSVTVLTQPTAQSCLVTNGNGVMGGANVTNVTVTCTTLPAEISISLSQLALSVTGLTEYGIPSLPNPTTASGLPRVITITNTGSETTLNLAVAYPTWPAGTSDATTCPPDLAPGNTCTITITPGATPTATTDGTPCSNGTAPIPGIITVSGDNTNTVSTDVVVLNYGCVYQEGYVFAFDDTTANTASVGGKVVNSVDVSTGIRWGGQPFAFLGSSITNGVPNTQAIVNYYGTSDESTYAAGLCSLPIQDYSDWYLPAICEMSYDFGAQGAGCGSVVTPLIQNIYSSVNGLINTPNQNVYWTSTDLALDGAQYAWAGSFPSTSDGVSNKLNGLYVRCTRLITPTT